MAWLEDIKARFNAIQNDIRAFVAGLIRDPRGSASDFKARLTEAENIALYVCINEKIPKSLKTMIWPSQVQEGTGLLQVYCMHCCNTRLTRLIEMLRSNVPQSSLWKRRQCR